ncbi:hypothetical protein Acsp02_14270 [Actinoplanes sp. NBRC 103695]|nr:hypothetical protein Acsp02_14270 [Actinoplanes sp. NBRC 103695]
MTSAVPTRRGYPVEKAGNTDRGLSAGRTRVVLEQNIERGTPTRINGNAWFQIGTADRAGAAVASSARVSAISLRSAVPASAAKGVPPSCAGPAPCG